MRFALPTSLVALVAVVAASPSLAQDIVVNGANSPYTIAAATTVTSMTVEAGGQLFIDAPLTVTADMGVLGGGFVSHSVRDPDFVLDVGGALTIFPGGSIDVTGKGLRAGNAGSSFGGAGETLDPFTFAIVSGAGGGIGGSHGGRGAGSSPATFGSQEPPTTFGGGGGGGGCGGLGGAGGGKVHIVAATLRVDGTLKADGGFPTGGCGAGGGGGGGSIRLEVGTWAGSGSVSAAGGVSGAANGGGGRVYVSYVTRTFTGTVSAGQPATGVAGASGTSFLESTAGAF